MWGMSGSEERDDQGGPLGHGGGDWRIEESCVRFTTSVGAARTIPMDNVIIAKGAAGERSLADALLSAGLEVSVVGDAAEIGYIEGAMRGAAEADCDRCFSWLERGDAGTEKRRGGEWGGSRCML